MTNPDRSHAAEPGPEQRRRRAIQRVAAAANAYGTAADSLNDAAAKVLGVNRTDMRLIALLRESEAMASTQLARAAGLSPGATTTAVGRLVDAGYVAQHTDPDDGRRNVLTLTKLARRALTDLYGPMLDTGQANLRDYAYAELRAIESFLQMATALQHSRALELLTERVSSQNRRS